MAVAGEKALKSGSNLERVLAAGHFAVTAEAGPPQGTDPEVIREKGQRLKDYTDAINVTDNQTAVVRLCSLAGCVLLKEQGADPVMQIVCRDRNRLAIQADVLGAVALGVRNFLCLTGDHQKFGNHPTAKGVYDLDSIQLIAMLKKLRDEKKFQCGDDIKRGEVPLFIGAAENPYADPFEFRAIRLAKKVSAGADFIQTQAVYDVDKFALFMKMARDLGLIEQVHILAGIIPVRRAGMASYMQTSVPGVYVPQQIVDRMRAAKGPEAQAAEGVKLALEIIEQVRAIPGVHGIHIMAVGWEDIVPTVVEKAGLYPRPKG